ncbi:MAG: hypothetical protein K9M45_07120 [Kiritimatiellales bacterium]|nr:hypothetical protein [Kiritimatiellales bacterium]
MKKTEKIALIGIILYLISWSLNVFRPLFIMQFINSANSSKVDATFFALPLWIVMIAFNVAIAIWLFIIAKREKTIPLVWALFGLISGLLAPVLFYAVRIYEILDKQKNNSEPIK